MKKNVGSIDRKVRIALGVVIAAAGIYWQSAWGLIAIIPLLTGFISWCPAYAPFGISSCSNKQD